MKLFMDTLSQYQEEQDDKCVHRTTAPWQIETNEINTPVNKKMREAYRSIFALVVNWIGQGCHHAKTLKNHGHKNISSE